MTTILYGIEHLDVLNTCSICFDTETTQLQPCKGGLRLLQLGAAALDTVVVIDCWELSTSDWRKLKLFFSNGERFWLAHNAQFDIGWLQEHDITVRGRIHCSFLASRLLDNGIPNLKHGLADVVKRYLKRELSKEQQRSDWSAPVLSPEQLEYAANDVVALMELDAVIHNLIATEGLAPAYALECKALPAMAAMWRCGLPWNKQALQQRMRDYEFDIQALGSDFLVALDQALPEGQKLPREDDGTFNLRAKDEGSIRLGTKKYHGFNLNSPKQLVERFTAVLGTTPVDPKTGKPSASRQALRSYAADHEVVQVYLAWKRAEKRRQMCVSILERMDPDGFVRASYLQLGADTGRTSCIKPNNQQIPRDEEFRACVEAPEGWELVDADFSQMELRLLAAIAGDETMIQGFVDGVDPHTVTAERLGCSRQVAKSANFGLAYGSGAKGLRDYAGSTGTVISLEEASEIRDKWLETFQGVARWHREQGAAADATRKQKWTTITIPGTGMRRFLLGDENRLTIRANTPIQGAGAAILKVALGNLWPLVQQAGEDEVRIAAAVHDEILLLVREGSGDYWAQQLKQVMEDAEAKWLGRVPALAEAHVGKRWSETH